MKNCVIVTGSRDWTDENAIGNALDEAGAAYDNLDVIMGDCRGADQIAAEICRESHQPFIQFRADWDKFGRGAGPHRNQLMLDYAKAYYDNVLVLAFPLPDSKGTKHMIKIAQDAGVDVKIIEH
jgi:hypothetical protein